MARAGRLVEAVVVAPAGTATLALACSALAAHLTTVQRRVPRWFAAAAGGAVAQQWAVLAPLLQAAAVTVYPGLLTQLGELLAGLRAAGKSRGPGRGWEEEEVLGSSCVLFCTLAATGRAAVQRALGSRAVAALVVDEAAQATEAEVLLACITATPRRLVLVGDPCQLPATVISPHAEGLSRSMMERLQLARAVQRDGWAHGSAACVLLTQQHRMHPDLAELPSRLFYSGRLETPAAVSQRRVGWGDWASALPPLLFLHVEQGAESAAGQSWCNLAEVELCSQLLSRMQRAASAASAAHRTDQMEGECRPSIGVISPYNGQCNLLRQRLSTGASTGMELSVRSIDGCQGAEFGKIFSKLST